MSNRKLNNKPLVEALLEIKWELVQNSEDEMSSGVDSHYKLLLSRIYDNLSGPEGKYPFPEELPSAKVPDEYVGHIVTHRFYSNEKEPPLIQLGPGVITLNETNKYTWGDFQERSSYLYNKLLELHPNPKELKVNNISLKYMNVIEFDYDESSVLDFLNGQMKLNVSYPTNLFDPDISPDPFSINYNSTFKCNKPEGKISAKIGTGLRKNNQKVIIFELNFISSADFSDLTQTGFDEWLSLAHAKLETWFFTFIEGELVRRFE